MKHGLILGLSLVLLTVRAVAAEPVVKQLKVERQETLTGGDGQAYWLELLGSPLEVPTARVSWVTTGPGGGEIAWAAVRSPEIYGLLGYHLQSGKRYWADLSAYHGEHGLSSTGGVGGDSIYLLAGNKKTCIFKYHIPTEKLSIVQVIDQKKIGKYWLGRAVGPDGRIYWGVYPTASVIGVDPKTDKFLNYGPMSDDPNQMYVLHPKVDADNILYAPTGLEKPELYALNLATGEKKQIIGEKMAAELKAKKVKLVSLVPAGGRVYLELDKAYYLCTPDGVAETPSPPPGRRDAEWQPDVRFANGETPLRFTEYGLEIRAADRKSTRVVPVEFPDIGHELYTVGSIRDGVLYGSGIFGANVFGLDLKTLRSTDYGVISGGSVQNYELFDTPKGLILSSYSVGALDLFTPERPLEKGRNPRPLARLNQTDEQERIWGFPGGVIGNRVYSGSMPIKGHLGGTLVEIDLDDNRVTVRRNIIPNQTINNVYALPGKPGVLVFGSAIRGGTGTEPTEKEAVLAAWDIATEKILWTKKPFPHADSIEVLPTADGKLLVVSETSYLLFDPATDAFTPAGELPGRRVRHTTPDGPNGENYIIRGKTLYSYTPAHGFRKLFDHDSFEFAVSPKVRDGFLYYGENSRLWRIKSLSLK
jgi:hypothetical protein